MKRALVVTAALVAAVTIWVARSLPPRLLALDSSWRDGTVPGVLHVHTNRSDGLGPPEAVAAAAARAGLKFIVFTDHGDATRDPDPPTYRAGVLCIDGVEISTTGGHYVAIDLGKAPYPLGGEPRDVAADVERLGGLGIAAHPDSPKRELAWRDWSTNIDGLEVLTPDTGWREHASRRGWRARVHLLTAIATYPWRPAETIGALLTPSSSARGQWDQLLAHRTVVGVAGVDAHARLALRDTEPGDTRLSLPIPSYEASFRALSVHVTPSGPLTGDAAVDAARLIAGLRQGKLYSAIDAWATPPQFRFSALSGAVTVEEGEAIAPADDLVLHIRHNGADGFLTSVRRGREAVTTDRTERDFTVAVARRTGAYRVEIHDPRHANGPAWITSNPIYVRDAEPSKPVPLAPGVRAAMVPPGSPRPGAEPHIELFDGRTTSGWTTESDPSSVSAISVTPSVGGPQLRVRYGLAGGTNTGQFAGVAVDTLGGAGAFNRITFTARGDRPMRMSIQVRADVRGAPPERWQRSIYLDDGERPYSVAFDDMTAVAQTHTPTPPRATIRNIMFIVDTTNTRPGVSGNVWLKDLRMER